jgi:hypothetical protein
LTLITRRSRTRRRGHFVAVAAALVAILLSTPSFGATSGADALRLVTRLQERLEGCQDYQCLVTCFERNGTAQEERSYRLYVKDPCLVRIKVVAGRGKGCEATRDRSGRIRARKAGLLKAFPKTLSPDDRRILSLRGTPFWEATGQCFLERLHACVARPDAQCDVGPDTEEPRLLLLQVHYSGPAQQKVWIDPQQMRLVRCELYEGGDLIQRFTVSQVKENTGLKDSFFSF